MSHAPRHAFRFPSISFSSESLKSSNSLFLLFVPSCDLTLNVLFLQTAFSGGRDDDGHVGPEAAAAQCRRPEWFVCFSTGNRPPALGGRSPQSSFDSNGDVGQISLNWMRVNGTIAPFKALLTSTTSNSDKQVPPVQKASITSNALIRTGSIKRQPGNHVPHPIICEITKRKESTASCRITDIVAPRLECGDALLSQASQSALSVASTASAVLKTHFLKRVTKKSFPATFAPAAPLIGLIASASEISILPSNTFDSLESRGWFFLGYECRRAAKKIDDWFHACLSALAGNDEAKDRIWTLPTFKTFFSLTLAPGHRMTQTENLSTNSFPNLVRLSYLALPAVSSNISSASRAH
ncbi:hypothetical protein L596_008720 [Steinernema carpocapsae]|uniref:Uncharacterized protein n=1 Tax=Steinernema carpocapsae TaxID=34508 RepID=A0A4U5PDV0_STECR|nr:hypothetical protein L596_008720 [Steinernema carpocapsae]